MDNSALERMAQYIITSDRTSCTDWSGGKDQEGYPMFWYKGKTERASRVLWKLIHGSIPAGMVIRHKCDNPACLQVDHLLIGTPQENTQDAKARGRLKGPVKMTSEKIARLEELMEINTPRAAIAAELGVSVSTLYSYILESHKRIGKYARGDSHWNWHGESKE